MLSFAGTKICDALEILVAIAVGLCAGELQVRVYTTLFDVAFDSVKSPDSLVFGAFVRVAH